MDISEGYSVEVPKLLIPWNISHEELKKTLDRLGPNEGDARAIGFRCISLNGLSHSLGIRFYERPATGVWYFQLSQNQASYPEKSFEVFQKHLEAAFGEPTTVTPGEEGFPSYTWQRNGIVVLHRVQERFGPAEIVRIERISGNVEPQPRLRAQAETVRTPDSRS